MMRLVDFLREVRDGRCQGSRADTIAAIGEFIAGVVQGQVPDYQASAFLMAVYHQGLDAAHTTALTLAMRDSGTRFNLDAFAGLKIDKHSTGGVGDKISLALAPIAASCGLTVPMVCGRGLGHTGGTLDKLESIPGFRVDLSNEQFYQALQKNNVVMMGQTHDFCPADKKLYSLRDVTATVESIPLIVASILSKKLAEGIDGLVLDVKVGAGAFMKTLADARALAKALVEVGTAAGVRVRALLTRMEEPLGHTIGNALEVKEALDILQQRGPQDTTELTLRLAAEMVVLGKQAADLPAARERVIQAISSGQALEKFRDLIATQGGDPYVVDDRSRLPQAPHQTSIRCPHKGYVSGIDSYSLGMLAMQLGAGRAVAEANIDPSVGLEIKVRRGDWVEEGQELAILHHQTLDQATLKEYHTEAAKAFVFSAAGVDETPLVIEEIGT
jgi:pyrimidine-nucleoside phosphorylase